MYKRTGRQSDNPCINEWCGECEPIMSDCKLLFKHNNYFLPYIQRERRSYRLFGSFSSRWEFQSLVLPVSNKLPNIVTPVKVGCVVAINNYTVPRLN